ncbi:FAD binding domain-containing protein [Albimonas pacifica]|uniref:Carbon-monoxide dehydrogenase medium subunit n=1 Tax=Albimonas pacifica TaxID=1114924 RepID=A0A1I3EKQ3_9RHOB|nr:xanthine dehydrogenase family protein subunit M [Albimonas pacifica]SFH99547.1 carbon-monoxide dehydrogenase medium subunit [Albimonas pacifica]
MYAFDLVKPKSLAEAIEALQADEAQPLGGGQTLIPTLKQRLAMPGSLVSLAGIAELVGISASGGVLSVKGATTHGAVAAQTDFPGLAGLAGKIGDPAVRHRGTMGGSIANNDPAACYPSAALACGATIVVAGKDGTREIAADDYFQGLFTTALEEGEIVTEIRYPIPQASNYQKFEQPASRFPLVGVFVAKFADKVGVAVTGAGENGVFHWEEAEAALASNFSPEAVEGLTVSADGLMGDIHATPEYRAHLIKVMTKRAVAACA